ncbi:NADH:ubiquinone oxidoreductase kDa subunit [Atractiella rhizophila]|nr:NADH:ubiquinone oxidoreductase kDa subunit [Atractiella rhizophila]
MLSLSLPLRRAFSTSSIRRTARALTETTDYLAETPLKHPQAPNRVGTWSRSQQPREEGMVTARHEQTNLKYQPQPLAAIEMIAQEPVRMVKSRIAVCDGGYGPLGHPKIYINLDKPGPKACGYCGLRYEKEQGHGHHH